VRFSLLQQKYRFAALGALLWTALLLGTAVVAAAQGLAAAPASPAPPQPQLLQLTSSTREVPLAGRSQYWVEDGSALRAEDIEARQSTLPFRSRADGDTHLLEGKTLWVRFDARVDDTSVRWHLELMLAGVDRAELSYRDQQGQWITQAAGDSLPLDSWPQAGRYPVFALSQHAHGDVRYFLRVSHARVPFSARMQVVSHTQLNIQHEKEQFLLGGYFGLAALVVLVAAANAVANRDWGFGTYAVYVALLAMAQGVFTGVSAQYLWPGYPQLSQAGVFFLPLLATASGLMFVRTVTAPRRFSPALDWFVLSLASLLVVVGLIDVLLPTSEGFAVTNTLIAASMSVLVMLVVLSLLEGDRNGRWLAMGFVPVLVTAVFPLLRNFGLMPSSVLTEYGLMLGSALETPILFYGLHRRLTIRGEARARARALSQTDPLTGLAHPRILLLRLQGALMRATRYRHQCSLLVIDFANYGTLLREYGREAADGALVLAAARLRAIVRDVDTAARVGDHQFALLVEGPSTAQDAQDVATHAVARGLHDSELLPPGESLRFHVAIATLPQDASDASAVLAHLISEVRQITPDSRKTIRNVQALGGGALSR
jgi:diguanylate cyclase (GGDEF)-like protein